MASLLAMTATTALGLVAQRWMTYEIVGVDASIASWCFAAAVLAVMGLMTALIVGVPSYMLMSRLGLSGTPGALAFCVVASAVTVIAYQLIVSFASTAYDHAVIPALCLVFHGVLYASYYRGAPQLAQSKEAADGLGEEP